MAGQLCYRERRFADSASKTHTPPANPRRTPLCHPDHHLKRKERGQAVGLIRSPLKRMGVGLGAAYGSCSSVRIAIDIAIFCNAISMRFPRNPCLDMTPLVGMRWHLLNGQSRLPDSASKTTTPPPANLRRMPLCHPDHHLKRKERRQAIGLVRAPLKRMGVRLGTAHLSRIVSNNFVQRGRRPPCVCPARGCFRVGVPMHRHLLDGQGGFPDSTSKTHIFPKKQITEGDYV